MNETGLALTGQSILLVEDEPGLQEALALVLELEGFEVTRASDGQEGVACLQITRPDLIITDYMMPRMTGMEMINRIRQNPEFSDVPILLMSAALPTHVDITAANGFLQKPMRMKQLLRIVRQLLHVDVEERSQSDNG